MATLHPRPPHARPVTWQQTARMVLRHLPRVLDDYRYALVRQVRDRFLVDADPGPDTTVILLPGIWESTNFLQPLARALTDDGHRVRTITSVRENLGAPELAAARVASYLERHDIARVTLVAHSKGGLVAKYLMQQASTADRIAGAVCLCTPFDGSRWGDVLLLPGLGIRELRRGNPWVTALASDATANERITSIYPTHDQHVPDGSYLEGATNVEIDAVGHSRVLSDPRFVAATLSAVRGYAQSDAMPGA